jgi:hypothetical protein
VEPASTGSAGTPDDRENGPLAREWTALGDDTETSGAHPWRRVHRMSDKERSQRLNGPHGRRLRLLRGDRSPRRGCGEDSDHSQKRQHVSP